MIFAGLIISAVAVLLGFFTKLLQGGGGLANNLMPMSLFYSSPPLLTPPPPRAIFFDIDSAILEAGHYYIRNSLSTEILPQDQCLARSQRLMLLLVVGICLLQIHHFQLPDFSIPAFAPLLYFY